jgi:integrase
VFNAAVRDRLIPVSPCVGIRLPRTRRSAVSEVLTTEQVQSLAAAVPDRYAPLILAGAGTGLRPGELFGPTAASIDFEGRTLRVNQQLVRLRGKGVQIGPLKTESSYRDVPLDRFWPPTA